ncbi:site-2 protease family protein [Candidatus Shapirobacteria bacterium]|nr:site-2 protease family protein [Candidatus Shapirobacteria bacterium]
MLFTALVFLIILSVLVLIHELGHFLVAKRLGIKVEEFGFGFPPRAFGIKRGETIYSINWLPIGGFVKLYGEDAAGGGKITSSKSQTPNKDLKRAFFARGPWQKASVVVAGVLMNTVLASIIFYIFLFMSNFTVELPLLGDHKFFFVNQQNLEGIIVNKVVKNSPAQKAGIKEAVKITEVNGQKITNTKYFLETISANKGKEVTIAWQDIKTNKLFEAKLTPRINPPRDEGALGVRFFSFRSAKLTYETNTQKIFSGISHPLNLMDYNLSVLKTLIGASFKQKSAEPLSGAVSGPVGIYSLVGNIIEIPEMKERVMQILNLAGILSISLAFFNILPIPALDGGRLFFILIEGITGKKVPQKFESMVHTIGMAILLTLLLLITFQDIGRFFIR